MLDQDVFHGGFDKTGENYGSLYFSWTAKVQGATWLLAILNPLLWLLVAFKFAPAFTAMYAQIYSHSPLPFLTRAVLLSCGHPITSIFLMLAFSTLLVLADIRSRTGLLPSVAMLLICSISGGAVLALFLPMFFENH